MLKGIIKAELVYFNLLPALQLAFTTICCLCFLHTKFSHMKGLYMKIFNGATLNSWIIYKKKNKEQLAGANILKWLAKL